MAKTTEKPTLAGLCLNRKERQKLINFIKNMPHALMLVADEGFGKSTLAKTLADEVTGGREYLQLRIEPIENASSISIDQVRQLKSFFALKTNDATSRRVVIIDKSDFMTTEAQNSILKVLEEPPANCHLILTTSHPQRLLPTILSRTTIHTLIEPSRQELTEYFHAKGYPQKDIDHALAMSGTLAGITSSILQNENSPIVESVQNARNLLAMTTLERLKSIDKLTKDKQSTHQTLEAIKIIAEATVLNLANSGKPITKWKTILASANTALAQLDKNASPKLVLTNLFLSI